MADQHDLSAKHFAKAFGGLNGLIDSGVPAIVFIAVRVYASLNTAILAAVVTGMLILLVRKAQGQSLQYAYAGFGGLLFAVLIARATGSGKGFFLPGIILTGFFGFCFALSNLIGQPAIAQMLMQIDPKYAQWKTNASLKRACVRSTWVWAASFFIRCGVATVVALTVGDNAKDNAILFGVIQVEKYALLLGAIFYTIAAVRTTTLDEVPPAAEPV